MARASENESRALFYDRLVAAWSRVRNTYRGRHDTDAADRRGNPNQLPVRIVVTWLLYGRGLEEAGLNENHTPPWTGPLIFANRGLSSSSQVAY